MLCHICIGRCYALDDVIAMYVVVDGKPQRQVLLPLLYQCGRCYCHSFASIEQACTQLKLGEAEELRGEVKTILKKIQPSKSDINREEQKALAELRKDKNRIILTAGKGISMVVMDRENYIRKAEELLGQPAYRPCHQIQEQVNISFGDHQDRRWE